MNDDTVNVPGWLTDVEGKLLARLAKDKLVLEIGSYCGRSTVWMARTAKHVHCVDTFKGTGWNKYLPDTWTEFCITLVSHDVEHKVTARVGMSKDVVPSLPHEFNLIFIDGSHDAASVRLDLQMSLGKLSADGLIALHDYGRHDKNFDVTREVNRLLNRGELEQLELVDAVIVVKPVRRYV